MGLGLFQKYWLDNAESHGTVALMDHLINDKGSSPGWRRAVALLRFHSQLDLLNADGWQTVCVRNLRAPLKIHISSLPRRRESSQINKLDSRLRGNDEFLEVPLTLNNRLPEHNIMITIDDEYADNLAASEKLQKHGMHTTWFIMSGSIGRKPVWPNDGRPDGRCVNAVREVGYRAACATRTGWALLDGAPHQLRRLTVFNSDTTSSLARKLFFGSNDASWHTVSRYALQRVTSRMIGRRAT